jgi:PAS domain S-box-containing protein
MDPLDLLSPIESSLFFKKMFHNAGLTSILVLDLKGNIIDVNSGFLKTFGYSKDSVIGKNFSMLFTEEDKLKQLPENELEETIETGSSNDENYLLKGDGFPTWVHGESILTEVTKEKQYIIKIVHDTHTQKLLEEELVKKNEEQDEIIKDHSLFIHTASHDLRSPISNITGLVNSLKESHDDPKELELIIKMLDQSVERLKNRLNELAAVGKEREEATEVEFHKALNDVLLDLKEEIKDSEAEITSDFSKAPIINFPRKNLKSILQNLISNSVKFRSPHRKPKILIDTEKSGDGCIVLRVSDNGLGIQEKDREKIFRMYHRLNPGIQGTGVGMTIIKRMVENSGGKIELESKIGEGSTFKIFLPSSNPFR